jgi:hypothetical protein
MSGVQHRQTDDAFAEAWQEAEQIAADRLEAEAWRRGVEGVPEPRVSAGKLVHPRLRREILKIRYVFLKTCKRPDICMTLSHGTWLGPTSIPNPQQKGGAVAGQLGRVGAGLGATDRRC